MAYPQCRRLCPFAESPVELTFDMMMSRVSLHACHELELEVPARETVASGCASARRLCAPQWQQRHAQNPRRLPVGLTNRPPGTVTAQHTQWQRTCQRNLARVVAGGMAAELQVATGTCHRWHGAASGGRLVLPPWPGPGRRGAGSLTSEGVPYVTLHLHAARTRGRAPREPSRIMLPAFTSRRTSRYPRRASKLPPSP